MAAAKEPRVPLKLLSRTIDKRFIIRLSALLLTAIFSFGSLIFPISTRPSSYSINIGDVAAQDIQAPETLTYTSTILTDKERESAEKSVGPIFNSADPTITRRQIERLRVTLNYITATRLDVYATKIQKINDLSALAEITLDQQTLESLVDLTETRWQSVSQEAINVLDQVMRKTIRENQLDETRQSVPTIISFSIPEDQALIVEKLVTPFITANSLYNNEATNSAKQKARDAILPVSKTFIKGQIIVNRGSVITPVEREALEQFGLIEPPKPLQTIFSAAFLVLLLFVISILYFRTRHLAPINEIKGTLLTAITFLVFLYAARLIIPNRTVIPYFLPVSAFGLTVASLYSSEAGVILSLTLSILTAFGLSPSLDLTLYYLLTSISGILILGKGKRVLHFFWAGIAVGLSGSAVILAFRLPDTNIDLFGIATLIGTSFLNGMASASLTLLLQFILSQILGLTTSLQLLDLSRSDHPLLQLMLRKIPGSYQHSLQVANLAEQAAEAINADALLTRVGALYHDAGKISDPSFFIENQPPGQLNTHDDMDPASSAATIIKHVTDGLQLARKYRLPTRIQDFIREHHGTLLTRYQYSKALSKAQNNPQAINENLFRYPGPRPRSRETALLMLADGCEARVRSEMPQNEDDLRAIVQKTFEYCQKEGQLDKTTLTLYDLSLAREAFIKTLQNTYHPRMKYPEMTPSSQPKDKP